MDERNLEAGWNLVEVSWGILRQNLSLLWVMVGQAIIGFFVGLVLIAPIVNTAEFIYYRTLPDNGLPMLLIGAFISVMAGLFSTGWLASAAEPAIRYRNGEANLGNGFSSALEKIGTFIVLLIIGVVALFIFAFFISLVAGTTRSLALVYVIALPILLVVACWVYLTIPVIMFEDLGALAAIGRSTELMKQNWSQWLGSLLGMLIIYIIIAVVVTLVVNLITQSLLVSQLVQMGLNVVLGTHIAIYMTALYQYAVQEERRRYELYEKRKSSY